MANQHTKHPTTVAQRFWAKVQRTDNCWLWTACVANGYGRFYLGRSDGRKVFVVAHRFAYELANGVIPDGLVLDHLCRNRSCVNPDHLEIVTRGENVRRGLKGRMVTRCAQGHAYTPENTYVRPDNGRRQCRTCRRDRTKRGTS